MPQKPKEICVYVIHRELPWNLRLYSRDATLTKMCFWKAQIWKMFGRDILSDWCRGSSYVSSALLNEGLGVRYAGSDCSFSDYLGKLLNSFDHQFPQKNIRDNNFLYFIGWLWWFDEVTHMKMDASGTWHVFKKWWLLCMVLCVWGTTYTIHQNAVLTALL